MSVINQESVNSPVNPSIVNQQVNCFLLMCDFLNKKVRKCEPIYTFTDREVKICDKVTKLIQKMEALKLNESEEEDSEKVLKTK